MLELNEKYVQLANYNSVGGRRGDISKAVYEYYCNLVNGWPVEELKKQSLLEELYIRYSRILKYEAGNIRVIVTGTAGINQKWDSVDKAFRLRNELNEWFSHEEKMAESIKQ